MKTITDTITLALPAAAFPMDPERILFFDIETTGCRHVHLPYI